MVPQPLLRPIVGLDVKIFYASNKYCMERRQGPVGAAAEVHREEEAMPLVDVPQPGKKGLLLRGCS